jgi:hypothetical protein
MAATFSCPAASIRSRHAGQDCDECLQFIPGKSKKAMGECKVVEGSIDPRGGCIALVKKS